MKSVAEILSIIREQVKLSIFESEEEAISEYKIVREWMLR